MALELGYGFISLVDSRLHLVPPCSLHSLRCFQPLVPSCLGREKPQYLVVAGLVFAPFVEPFIFDFEPPQPGRRRCEGEGGGDMRCRNV